MWNYTSTNVINSDKYIDGSDAWIVNVANESGEGEVSTIIAGGPKFTPSTVTSITKAEGYNGTAFKLTVDIASFLTAYSDENIFRLFLYIRSVGNNDPLYSNALTFKGRPFFVEFKKGDTVDKVIKNATKYQNAVCDKAYLKFSKVNSKLVIEGVNEYQYLYEARLQYLDESCPNCHQSEIGELFVTAESTNANDDAYGTTYLTINNNNMESFGTYARIMKDLRLPSDAHQALYAPMKDEMPIPGVIYNEYIVTQCSKRPEVRGSAVAIGSPVKSLTKHVFFVAQSLAEDFEDALANVFSGTIEEVPTQADPTPGE